MRGPLRAAAIIWPLPAVALIWPLLAASCDGEPPDAVGEVCAESGRSPARGAGVCADPSEADLTYRTPDSIDGRWLFGGRDRFEVVIEVEGERFEARDLDGEVIGEGAFTVERGAGNHWRITGGATDSSEPVVFELFFRSPDEAEVIVVGERSAATLLRISPIPTSLLGSWEIGFASNYHLAGGVLELRPDAWRVTVRDHVVRSGPAFGVGERSGVAEVVLREGLGAALVYQLTPAPGGTWIARASGTDDHLVLHAVGTAPTWVPPPTATVPAPSSPRHGSGSAAAPEPGLRPGVFGPSAN